MEALRLEGVSKRYGRRPVLEGVSLSVRPGEVYAPGTAYRGVLEVLGPRLLQELAREGVAILLSTHHLQEGARYAHRVGILGGGRLLDEVALSGKEAYRLEAEPLEGALALLKTLPQVASARLQGRSVVFEGEPEAALRALLAEGYRVRALVPHRFDLLDYYQERVRHV